MGRRVVLVFYVLLLVLAFALSLFSLRVSLAEHSSMEKLGHGVKLGAQVVSVLGLVACPALLISLWFRPRRHK